MCPRKYDVVTLKCTADAERHFGDQNVMCMRSGLVIKTAPVTRTSLQSSRLQSECQSRVPRDPSSAIATVAAGARPDPHPSSPTPPPQSVATEPSSGGAEAGDASMGLFGAVGSGGSGMSKSGMALRSNGATRPRSLDFMSIVTRFQLVQRTRALQLNDDTAGNFQDGEWIRSVFGLDFLPNASDR